MEARVQRHKEIARMETALYRFFNRDGELLYIGIALQAVSRIAAHLYSKPWANEITNITVAYCQSRKKAISEENAAIKKESPKYNIACQRSKHGRNTIETWKVADNAMRVN